MEDIDEKIGSFKGEISSMDIVKHFLLLRKDTTGNNPGGRCLKPEEILSEIVKLENKKDHQAQADRMIDSCIKELESLKGQCFDVEYNIFPKGHIEIRYVESYIL